MYELKIDNKIQQLTQEQVNKIVNDYANNNPDATFTPEMIADYFIKELNDKGVIYLYDDKSNEYEIRRV